MSMPSKYGPMRILLTILLGRQNRFFFEQNSRNTVYTYIMYQWFSICIFTEKQERFAGLRCCYRFTRYGDFLVEEMRNARPCGAETRLMFRTKLIIAAIWIDTRAYIRILFYSFRLPILRTLRARLRQHADNFIHYVLRVRRQVYILFSRY